MTRFIWAVGGGKGGVGKSVITSSLGIALARRGRRTALVDADLGGANLHTLLGVASPRRTLSDFVEKRVTHLSEVLVPTGVPGLSLVSGAKAMLEAANPKHAQKEKLLRHVRGLEVDQVLYDLGAGSAFNVLDFFLAGQRGVLVVIPEPTSVENAYHFLKAAFYRRLRTATRDERVKAVVRRVSTDRDRRHIRSPRDLLEAVRREDPMAGAALTEAAREFRPRIVVNQARRPEDRELGEQMRLATRSYFGTEADYLGAVPHDERVVEAVRLRRPILELQPSGAFARALDRILERLLAED